LCKIAIVGGYGGFDIGDEAMLTAVSINLENFIPNVKLLALSPNPEYTSEYHKIDSDYGLEHYLTGFAEIQKEIEPPHITEKIHESPSQQNIFWRILKFPFKLSIKWLKLFGILFNAKILKRTNRTVFLNEEGKRLLNHLKDADLLFNIGGANINNRACNRGLCGRFWIYSICKVFDKPIIISGQNIGPFDKWIDKKIAGHFLNKADVITLRDQDVSKGLLNELGVTKPIIKETADDAVSLPCANQEQIKAAFSDEKILRDYPLIGISINSWLRTTIAPDSHENLKKLRQVLAQVADSLISELGARIVFIPMDYNVISDDRVAAYEVVELMKHTEEVNVIVNGYDDQTLKGIISQMDVVIGTRLHFIILATTANVPAIGIYLDRHYKMKMGSILKLMEQEKYYLDFEKTSVEEIVALAKDALQNKEEIKKKLAERTKILGDSSLFTIEYARKLLTTETQVK
jgi:polysaccharide pyruvyl transferase WcaK-like protein